MTVPDQDMPPGLLTREACVALAEQVFRRVPNDAVTVTVNSQALAATETSRGMTQVVSNVTIQNINAGIGTPHGHAAWAGTTRFDAAGLDQLVREAKHAAAQLLTPGRRFGLPGPQVYPKPPQLNFASVLEPMTPDVRAAAASAAQDATERAGVVGAMNVNAEFRAYAIINNAGLNAYRVGSFVDCSLTARTKDGKGSGWGWSGFEDWRRVDTKAVIARAVDLCQRSANPVAVEPGRYTVILEPAAVAMMMMPLFQWSALQADMGFSTYSREPTGNNKIGLQMLDSRLQVVADPWDPDKPTPTFGYDGLPIPSKVIWFEDGILRNLQYDAGYAQIKGKAVVVDPMGARLFAKGEPTSLDDMIKSVKRGLWVNRLSNIDTMNGRTGLLTGTTRDGTFLIENGRITKAVKNFRFTESPFFVFNKLEAFGEPVRATREIVAPRLMVRDFDFTSLTDAV